MLQARPRELWIITGRMLEKNSDLAIVTLHSLSPKQVDFLAIRNIIDDSLHNKMRVDYRSLQLCSHGQAFVRFNYMHARDFLIYYSPHPYGNGTISFVAHNQAWNRHIAIMNHEVWLILLELGIDCEIQPLLEKAIEPFDRS